MDREIFFNQLSQIGEKAEGVRDLLQTEEATKQTLVIPFIRALGFDPEDISEVVPEYDAHVGHFANKKVDYVLFVKGKPAILIECKPVGTNLSIHFGQLFEYFGNVGEAKWGVLTNGDEYWFYSDTVEVNRLDKEPCLKLSLSGMSRKNPDLCDKELDLLSHLRKPSFDLGAAMPKAAALLNRALLGSTIRRELSLPSDDLVRVLAKLAHVPGNINQGKAEVLRVQTKELFEEYLLAEARKMAGKMLTLASPSEGSVGDNGSGSGGEDDDDGIVTTPEEIEGFYIVKAICAECVDPGRIHIRDLKSYCKILLDNRVQKPIAVFHFGPKKLAIDLFDQNGDAFSTPLDSLSDMYGIKHHIISSLKRFL